MYVIMAYWFSLCIVFMLNWIPRYEVAILSYGWFKFFLVYSQNTILKYTVENIDVVIPPPIFRPLILRILTQACTLCVFANSFEVID